MVNPSYVFGSIFFYFFLFPFYFLHLIDYIGNKVVFYFASYISWYSHKLWRNYFNSVSFLIPLWSVSKCFNLLNFYFPFDLNLDVWMVTFFIIAIYSILLISFHLAKNFMHLWKVFQLDITKIQIILIKSNY